VNTKKTFMRFVSIIVIILLVTPLGGIPTASGQASGGQYSKDELAQMVAPIALYPDSLLSQVLMAASYPLEIVEADRWVQKNKKLKGDKLGNALKDKTWDSSTKSLCYYPEVLSMLSEKLEWTTKLGNAFLNQQAEVMGAVQELRAKAKAQGNLQSNAQQKVVVEENKYIVIQPANPEVVYVPAYNPTVVYGSWPYPAYPPYPYYYPGAALVGGAIAFGAGFAVGAAVAGWSGCRWGAGTVNVNVNRTANFNNANSINRATQYNKGNNWNHNPQNRQGVAYNNKATAQKYGQSASRAQQGSRDARGYGQAQSRQGQGVKQSAARQPQAQQRGASQRDSAFSGSGNRQSERAAASRGQQSRSSSGFGGGSRGGGGFGGGGGSRGGGARGGGGRRR
jgi:uncharacterized membrane protein YgcG